MKGKWKVLTALLMVCLLVICTPRLTGPARAVDLDAACALTVTAGSQEMAEDIAEAGVVLDLYKVADAVPVSGSDAYAYEAAAPYSGLVIPAQPTQEDWATLEQQAAAIALSGGDTPFAAEQQPNEKIESLSAGLYLVVARGAGLEEYTTTVTGDDGVEKLGTLAESRVNRYTFLPELVSLPGKAADEDGVLNTANPGDWLYEVEITLKPEQDSRLSSIEIVKTLTGFNGTEPATFVFSVEATYRDQPVYSNVVPMVFTGAGTQRVTVEGLPIGAEVTVTEVYSGASYALVTADSQNAVVSAEEIVSVEFTNTPTTERKAGGSITNRFAYDAEGGWTWTPIPDAQ